jgi:hypothetical protein
MGKEEIVYHTALLLVVQSLKYITQMAGKGRLKLFANP